MLERREGTSQRISVSCHVTSTKHPSLFIWKEVKMLHGSWVCTEPQLRATLDIQQVWISG